MAINLIRYQRLQSVNNLKQGFRVMDGERRREEGMEKDDNSQTFQEHGAI